MSSDEHATSITLRDGRTAMVRALRPEDSELLVSYFEGFSDASRRYYGPHAFDRETAERLCAEIDEAQEIRFIAILGEESDAEMIGYMILTRKISESDQKRYGNSLDLARCACLAPSIADAYQSQGIGTQMAEHVIARAQAIGLRQVILMGGVVAKNERARRLYESLGFRHVRDFCTQGKETLLNHDMIIEF